jgi:hypothetical protein
MKKLLVPLLAIFLLASCSKERLVGSGPVVTESRNAANFTKVTTSGSTNVHIEKGTAFSVQVKGHSNLLPHFETRVNNQTLEVGYKDVTSIRNDNVEVFVTLPAFEGVRINGSADIAVKDDFSSNRMDFSISGSGTIDFETGTTQNLYTDISGSGSIRLYGLTTSHADVSLSGSGTMEVNVATRLKATISGSGTVYYKGNPVIESTVSGSGKIIHHP